MPDGGVSEKDKSAFARRAFLKRRHGGFEVAHLARRAFGVMGSGRIRRPLAQARAGTGEHVAHGRRLASFLRFRAPAA